MNLPRSAVGFLDCRIQYPQHGAGNIGTDTVTLDVAHNRVVRDMQPTFLDGNLLSLFWQVNVLVTHVIEPLVDSGHTFNRSRGFVSSRRFWEGASCLLSNFKQILPFVNVLTFYADEYLSSVRPFSYREVANFDDR